MRSKSILLLVMTVILFTFQYLTQAAVDIADGGSHVINHNTYQSDSVYVDRNIAHDPGTHIDLVDGGVIRILYLFNKSSLNMTGGQVVVLLRGWQNSTIEISGGRMSDFYTLDNSTATMTGGTVNDELAAGFNSTITISGGSFKELRAYYDGKIYLVGSGFEVNGQPLSYGDKLSDYGTYYSSIPHGKGYLLGYYSGTITGTLADGSYINDTFYVDASDTSDIFVIPEPATLLLLGLGGLALLRNRRFH